MGEIRRGNAVKPFQFSQVVFLSGGHVRVNCFWDQRGRFASTRVSRVKRRVSWVLVLRSLTWCGLASPHIRTEDELSSEETQCEAKTLRWMARGDRITLRNNDRKRQQQLRAAQRDKRSRGKRKRNAIRIQRYWLLKHCDATPEAISLPAPNRWSCWSIPTQALDIVESAATHTGIDSLSEEIIRWSPSRPDRALGRLIHSGRGTTGSLEAWNRDRFVHCCHRSNPQRFLLLHRGIASAWTERENWTDCREF